MPRIVFTIFQLALLVGIILLGASIVYEQRDISDTGQMVQPVTGKGKQDKRSKDKVKPFSYYQTIARRNLFQTPKDEKAAQTAIDIETLKPTELKLKLWGTITGEDGMKRAVIEDQTNGKQALFRRGEDVSSAKIKMILREKVILSVKGVDQILEIEKPVSTSRPRADTGSARTVDSPRAKPSAAPGASARRAIRLKLSRLGPISDNPEDWNKYATTAPVKGKDDAGGLVLNRITPSSPLRRLGIRNGDVLISINDEPVNTLDDILEPLVEIAAGQELSLNIKRRGRIRQLDFLFE